MENSTPIDEIDSIKLFLRKLIDQESCSPYLLLFQHNSSSRELRHTETTMSSDAGLFARAGITSPQEASRRDRLAPSLWLRMVCEYILELSESQQIVWVSTKPVPKWVQTFVEREGRLRVIDCLSDPWGWDGSDQPHLTDLAKLKDILQEAACNQQRGSGHKPDRILVLDSTSPLIQYHGARKTLSFLTSIAKLEDFSLVVTGFPESALTSRQLLEWQDEAHGLVHLSGGTATIVRHGVRENSNVVRQEWSYRIVERKGGDQIIQVESTERGTRDTEESSKNTKTDVRPKVKLVLENDEGVPEKPSPQTPHIVVDDDDPEYDDYDEEDPDEDLDI